MSDDPRPYARLTVCAITGNCEKYFPRWLSHFGPMADEIVVVRAIGCQEPDGTLALAEAAGCVTGEYINAPKRGHMVTRKEWEEDRALRGTSMYRGIRKSDIGKIVAVDPSGWPHVDDFAAARNLAASLATGDWIMWADMDDILPEGGPHAILTFLRHVAATEPEAAAICLPYLVPEDGLETLRERIWRRGRAFWRGRVHETLEFVAPEPHLVNMDVTDPMRAEAKLIHAPEGSRQPNDERNLRILESIPEKERTLGERFHLFQSQRACGHLDAAVATAIGLAQDPATEAPERAEVFFSLGQLSDSLADRHAFFLQSLSVDPSRREAYGELAQTCINMARFEDALGWSTAMMGLGRPAGYIWNARDKYYRYAGLHIHTLALRANGRQAEAEVLETNHWLQHYGDISLLHATRGRSAQAWLARRAWYELAAEPDRIEHIFAFDTDDEKSAALALSRHVALPGGHGPVAAWNVAARMARGRILVQMSDDWTPPRGWDAIIREALRPALESGAPAVLRVSDGSRKDGLLCMAILTRARFEQQKRLLFHPGFFSVFSDDWFTYCAERDGVIIDRSDVVFQHNHPAFGKGEMDATYAASNAPEHYAKGKALFDRLVEIDGITYYSQCGQDEMVERWFREHGERSRRYVDIGAYDGVTFSNTKRFEDLGWMGICVEPCYESFEKLRKNRKALCYHHAAGSALEIRLLRYPPRDEPDFHGPALATLGEIPAKHADEEWKSEEIRVFPTADFIPPDCTEIDFLSIDTEGHDLEALKGWPWDRVKPRVIVVETGSLRQEILDYLTPFGYSLWHETNQDLFLSHDA